MLFICSGGLSNFLYHVALPESAVIAQSNLTIPDSYSNQNAHTSHNQNFTSKYNENFLRRSIDDMVKDFASYDR